MNEIKTTNIQVVCNQIKCTQQTINVIRQKQIQLIFNRNVLYRTTLKDFDS